MPKGIVSRCLFSWKEVQPSGKVQRREGMVRFKLNEKWFKMIQIDSYLIFCAERVLYVGLIKVESKVIQTDSDLIIFLCWKKGNQKWFKLILIWFFSCAEGVIYVGWIKNDSNWFWYDYFLVQRGSYMWVGKQLNQMWFKLILIWFFSCAVWVLLLTDQKLNQKWFKLILIWLFCCAVRVLYVGCQKVESKVIQIDFDLIFFLCREGLICGLEKSWIKSDSNWFWFDYFLVQRGSYMLVV